MTDNGLEILKKELKRIEELLRMNDGLRIRWVPDGKSGVAGEVRGKQIFLYDGDLESALETLRHEVVDDLVSQAIIPYKEITNRLILLVNERAYQEKEEIVERLVKLLSPSD